MQFTSAVTAPFKLINTRSLSSDGRQMLRLWCLWTLSLSFSFCTDNQQLLHKLESQGLGLLAVNWFCNYLSNSSQLLLSKGRLFSANGSRHPRGIQGWASSPFYHVNDLPSVCHSGSSKAVLKTLIINIKAAHSGRIIELFLSIFKDGLFSEIFKTPLNAVDSLVAIIFK